VTKLEGPDLDVVAGVAARGFYDDPVMNWVFPNDETRLEALRASMRMFAQRFRLRAGRVDVVDEACVAMWLPPDPPDLAEEDAPVPPADAWHHYAPDVVARFTILGDLMEEAHPKEPHWYLGVVATDPDHQGRGLGAQILKPVLETCDREGAPAYLESSNPRNLPFYYRQGWIQTGEIVIPEGPTLFPMWRQPL
jgi:GNAT superfamily N-acetyltransferase